MTGDYRVRVFTMVPTLDGRAVPGCFPRVAAHATSRQSSEMTVLLMWERIGVAWTLCWGAPRASARSPASLFRQARRGSARRISDGAPSCGALCSSGVDVLTELIRVLLRIVRRAQVSEACELGDRGKGVGGARAPVRRDPARRRTPDAV